MPVDIEKKRERDRKYRERKKAQNREDYLAKRRENNRRSYRKRKEEMTEREKRIKGRDRKAYMQDYRRKNPTPIASSSLLETSLNSSAKSVSATNREKRKKIKEIKKLRGEIVHVKRRLWKLQKRTKKSREVPQRAEKIKSPTKLLTEETLRDTKKTRKTVLAHFALLKEMRRGQNMRRNELKNTSRLIQKINKKYRLQKHFRKFTNLHHSTINSESSKPKPRANKVELDILKSFLEREDNSRMTSGKKEVVKRKGQTFQIRYFNFSVLILYNKFCSENPSISIGISSFYSYLKQFPYIKVPSVNSRDQCLCKHCTNTQLLVDALYTNKVVSTRDKQTLMNTIVCNNKSFICTHRECKHCAEKTCVDPINISINVIKYYQWESDGHVSITCKEKLNSVVSVVQQLETMMKQYAGHFFRLCHQMKEIGELRKRMIPGDLILHIDYSQNYSCKWAREIQSSFFGNAHKQIVIHQGVMYTAREEPRSFATLSEDSRKTSDAVAAHLESVLEEVKFNIKNLCIVSDSPSSQYRNKNTISLAILLCQKYGIPQLQWFYSEAGHGKGAPDGVGATIKRTGDRHVAAGNSILSAEDLVIVSQEQTKILTKIVTAAEINLFTDILKRSDIHQMKGISKAHHICFKENRLRFRQLACHCEDIFSCDCYNPIDMTLPQNFPFAVGNVVSRESFLGEEPAVQDIQIVPSTAPGESVTGEETAVQDIQIVPSTAPGESVTGEETAFQAYPEDIQIESVTEEDQPVQASSNNNISIAATVESVTEDELVETSLDNLNTTDVLLSALHEFENTPLKGYFQNPIDLDLEVNHSASEDNSDRAAFSRANPTDGADEGEPTASSGSAVSSLADVNGIQLKSKSKQGCGAHLKKTYKRPLKQKASNEDITVKKHFRKVRCNEGASTSNGIGLKRFEHFCVICGEPYENSKSKEEWIECIRCKLWAHILCTSANKTDVSYVCDFCN